MFNDASDLSNKAANTAPDTSAGASFDLGGLVQSAIDWPFLNEPIYRWAIFIGIFGGLTVAWGGILRYMRSEV